MALETGTYIDSLVADNPTQGDPKSQGAGHLRLVKSVLRNSFPGITGAVTATQDDLNHAKLVTGTAVSASGTSIDFIDIPSWAKRIHILFGQLSTSGTSNLLIQIGDSGGIEASGYECTGTNTGNTTLPTATGYSAGFGFSCASAANSLHGILTLALVKSSTNYWVAQGSLGLTAGTNIFQTVGSKSLSAVLDRVRVTTVNGTDTFDTGAVNFLYD